MQTESTEAIESDYYVERDYYVECGQVVFTEAYLLRRGQCCGNGCRHCPYRGSLVATDKHGCSQMELQK